MPDLDQDAVDPQDGAEVFDETHGVDEDPTGAFADDPDGDPAELTDVFDVTAAQGDADDDEDDAVADDMDDEALQDFDDEEDVDDDDDDDLDNDLEDQPEYDARAGLDRMIDRTAERAAPIEPGLSYVDDIDAITNPRDDEVEKYESTRALSDEQLADLGYLATPALEEIDAVKDETEATDGAEAISTKPEGSREWEERSFGEDAEKSLLEGGRPEATGSGARAEDVVDDADAGDDERLDEGLEETFPASDPVSAKHIT